MGGQAGRGLHTFEGLKHVACSVQHVYLLLFACRAMGHQRGLWCERGACGYVRVGACVCTRSLGDGGGLPLLRTRAQKEGGKGCRRAYVLLRPLFDAPVCLFALPTVFALPTTAPRPGMAPGWRPCRRVWLGRHTRIKVSGFGVLWL